MKAINVEDLPEPVALALNTVVQTLRAQLGEKRVGPNRVVNLPLWPGKVVGSLRREDVYASVG